MVISALNRKLLRDLLAMRGQALAIAMVVAAGVAMYVMYLANFASLRDTQRAYYQQQRFGDVFASLKRAPRGLGAHIAALPGVTAVELRVVAGVTLDMPGLSEPAAARLISLPAGRRPRVNDLFLRRGRWIDPARPDEVLASEGFVQANHLAPGDVVPAIVNGRLRRLVIAGVALSPEYIYSIRPGEMVPDDRRYGIFWMDERALASAFDMEGGFNDLSLLLAPGEPSAPVITALDRLLAPYGGLGAIPRSLQFSHWSVENELKQLQSFGLLLPLIFLMVAAFILNVALARALALQRTQIAALKALGYGNAALGWHYVKWALLVGSMGVAIGLGVGAWLGSAIGELYNRYFRFPELQFRLPWHVAAGAAGLTLVTAAIGTASAVRRAVRVPPAEAMRPEPPMRYRRTRLDTAAAAARLGMAGRIVLRNILRRPLRASASVTGIALAASTLMVGLVFLDAMDRLIATQFWVVDRQDVMVTFVEPRGPSAVRALTRLPGVLRVEPQRSVPVRLRAGHRDRYLAITGASPDATLRRIVDADGNVVTLPPDGVVLSLMLARALDVRVGDDVTIEVLEGARPVHRMAVTALVDDVLGLSVYMQGDALHAMMREGRVASGAALLTGGTNDAALSAALREMPGVAGASFKRSVLRTFREAMTANLNLTLFLNVMFAGVIAFGVVYNAARVSLSERGRELATLRVLGYTRVEISLILLGELALLTALALPAGAAIGAGIAGLIARTLESEVYRFPLFISRQSIAWSWLGTIGAALVSGLLVRRRLDRLDLVAVLKVGE